MNSIDERRAYIPASGAIALWSTVAVAFKLALRELTPLNLLTIAVFFSWISLGVVLLIKQDFKLLFTASRRSILYSAVLGLINPLAYYWILFAAYDRLPAQVAQPLNYTWPLFLTLLAAPVSGRKLKGRDFPGLFISLAGVVLIAHRPGDSPEQLNPAGVALALGSGLIWAFSWLAGTRIRIEGTMRLFISFSTALIVLTVIWIGRGRAVPSSSVGWISVLWVGLFEMGITFILWNTALERTRRPARIGNLVYIGPFISLLWISLILGETIYPVTVAGLAVIISGIFIGQNRKEK